MKHETEVATASKAPSAAACRAELALLLAGTNAVEREELLASGVALHTVNDLFPLDFELLVAHALSPLTYGNFVFLGGAHLDHKVIPQQEWMERIDMIKHVRGLLPEENRAQLVAEWDAIFPGSAYSVVSKLSREIGYRMSRYYNGSMADDLAGWYVRSLFMAYWLIRYSNLVQAPQAEVDEIMQWVGNRLLAPSESRG